MFKGGKLFVIHRKLPEEEVDREANPHSTQNASAGVLTESASVPPALAIPLVLASGVFRRLPCPWTLLFIEDGFSVTEANHTCRTKGNGVVLSLHAGRKGPCHTKASPKQTAGIVGQQNR